jgi:hypothetical protein
MRLQLLLKLDSPKFTLCRFQYPALEPFNQDFYERPSDRYINIIPVLRIRFSFNADTDPAFYLFFVYFLAG